MDSDQGQEAVTERYSILWHRQVADDFDELSQSLKEKIVHAIEHRLSVAPDLLGEPLRRTRGVVWKIRFSDYRILYVINRKAHEVWILAVRNRNCVYQNNFVQDLVKWAIALQTAHEQTGE